MTDTCGAHFAHHPDHPHLLAVCTRPLGHDGDHDNTLMTGARP